MAQTKSSKQDNLPHYLPISYWRLKCSKGQTRSPLMRNKLLYAHICSYSVNETSLQLINLLTYNILKALQAICQIVTCAYIKQHSAGRSEIQTSGPES